MECICSFCACLSLHLPYVVYYANRVIDIELGTGSKDVCFGYVYIDTRMSTVLVSVYGS